MAAGRRAGGPRVARAFAVGAVYDAAVTLWLLLPLMLYLTIATSSWLAKRANRALLFTTVLVAIGGALFVAVAEMLFFAEFDGRFNFVAVDYLIYPTEVVNNIWESYHAGWIVAAIVVVAGTLVYLARRPIRAAMEAFAPVRGRLKIAAAYVVVLARCSSLATPGLAHISDDRALNELASNGYYAFWEAFWGQGTSYDALYANARYDGDLPEASRPPRRRRLTGGSVLAADVAPPRNGHAAAAPAQRGRGARGKSRVAVHRHAEPGRRPEPNAALRFARERGHADDACLLDGEPDDPGARGDDIVAAAVAGHIGGAQAGVRRPVHTPCPAPLAWLRDRVRLWRARDVRWHGRVHAEQRHGSHHRTEGLPER